LADTAWVTRTAVSGTVLAVEFDRLTADQVARWVAVRAADPALDSPYFHPAFAEAVHRCGHRVVVAMEVDDAGHPQSFLPVHLRGKLALPVGWPGADFQGPIQATGRTVSLRGMMTALGARRLAFDHLLGSAVEFTPWVESSRPSPFIDVAGGLDPYLARASRSGRDNLGQARRRARKAEREVGPLRFVAMSDNHDLLDQVIALKRGQYAATGARDYFSDARHVDLVHDILDRQDPAFAGALSAVWAGDRLLAAHFGMRSGAVLHWWFPVYDPTFAGFAPGWVLLRELIVGAPELGLGRIDLGRGDDEYKRRAMTGQTTVHQGMVAITATDRAVRRVRQATLSAARSSIAAPVLKRGVRLARRISSRPIGRSPRVDNP
jgi:CelD/BcsL family acetyltransferase involved in cellulose biosynthesis